MHTHVAASLNTLVAHVEVLTALWIPFFQLLFLLVFPIWVYATRNSLFYGLFDLPLSTRWKLPIRHFAVSLSAFALGASACSMARLFLREGPTRLGTEIDILKPVEDWLNAGQMQSASAWVLNVAVPTLLTLVTILFVLKVSNQDGRSLPMMALGSLAGLGAGIAGAGVMIRVANDLLGGPATSGWLEVLRQSIQSLGHGYSGDNAWKLHAGAMLAAVASLALYAVLGVYGYFRLGKERTIPALASPLLALMVLGWVGGAAQFWLCAFHVPLLFLVVVLGVINTWIPGSDHTYAMIDHSNRAAGTPMEVLQAGNSPRAIVVAAAGGGIQAAAWMTRVLLGLNEETKGASDEKLRLLSGISGGSMGAACYVNWMANPKTARNPFEVASDSSLDEVAWGLAWPDLLRFFLPFVFGWMPDRAIALEHAWQGNSRASKDDPPQLTGAVSEWNERSCKGTLPGLIMNSTMVETGAPLMMGTTDIRIPKNEERFIGWKTGEQLHRRGGKTMDVPVSRAARLSASFPYVSPSARPAGADESPHMMDGGLYDNYGMATLTEWLNQALEEQEKSSSARDVKSVLIIETSGFPEAKDTIPKKTRAGWVFQLVAVIKTLVSVRTTSQVSNRDFEADLLAQKWRGKVEIQKVSFNYKGRHIPLSWHLTPNQIAAIDTYWKKSLAREKEIVKKFVAGPAAPAIPLTPPAPPVATKEKPAPVVA
ncbi:MAG TPA: patatin-like phospholipase family protein [Terracidiphilus sp.]|nr:patatin-like phospholipase family protein [Terracidiphilus sp.]